jgi:prepilin-type processing-associated H-X9-DG protein
MYEIGLKTCGNKLILKPNLQPMNSELKSGAFAPRGFQRSHHGGFTLTELMVVIATTGILVVLVLPTLGFSKAKPQAVDCLNHFNQLIKACAMYTSDNQGFYPPNPDDGGSTPGYCWVAGDVSGWMPNITAGGNAEAGDSAYLTDPHYSLLAPYLNQSAAVFKCPADPRYCLYQGQAVPVVRSVSANQGVGTVDASWLEGGAHSGRPTTPVPSPWLTGSHFEAQSKYATFGKSTSFKTCSPADIWIYVDDDPWTINDDAMAVVAEVAEFVDYPSTQHQNATSFAFADGHSELHKWASTVLVHESEVGITEVPTGLPKQDWFWWAWHATRSSITGTVP